MLSSEGADQSSSPLITRVLTARRLNQQERENIENVLIACRIGDCRGGRRSKRCAAVGYCAVADRWFSRSHWRHKARSNWGMSGDPWHGRRLFLQFIRNCDEWRPQQSAIRIEGTALNNRPQSEAEQTSPKAAQWKSWKEQLTGRRNAGKRSPGCSSCRRRCRRGRGPNSPSADLPIVLFINRTL